MAIGTVRAHAVVPWVEHLILRSFKLVGEVFEVGQPCQLSVHLGQSVRVVGPHGRPVSRSLLALVHLASLIGVAGLDLRPVGALDEWLNLCVRLIKLLDVLLLVDGVLERLNGVELTHRLLIQTVHASESALSDGFLVISQEEASELVPLEEVAPMILWLWQRKDLKPL